MKFGLRRLCGVLVGGIEDNHSNEVVFAVQKSASRLLSRLDLSQIKSHDQEIKIKFLNNKSNFEQIDSMRKLFSNIKFLQAKGRGGDKLPPGRSDVKCVKRKPNKSGGPDKVDLLVLIDLVSVPKFRFKKPFHKNLFTHCTNFYILCLNLLNTLVFSN